MNSDNHNEFFERRPTFEEAYLLAGSKNLKSLTKIAPKIRDRGHGNIISYSRKIFIPLTKLCEMFVTTALFPGIRCKINKAIWGLKK
ncbi:MAG: hypothetical protein CM1200mP30_21010 [Pseudomonadota bacterium]|nr:MAG: hypothetical protein CM1200mP30_21010 [Pseudomonadota bacterium]